MSFRAIYIIDPRTSCDRSKKVIFKRVFPVIEKKYQKALGVEKYKKIPLDFPNLVLEELELLRGKDEFIPKFDSCGREITHPVYSFFDGALYPVVAFQKGAFVYACIVWDGDDGSDRNKLLIDSPGIVFALTMLENMVKLVSKDQTAGLISSTTLEMLHKYVSIGFPFGIPTELDLNTVLAMASTAEGAALPKIKGPVWRPIAYKGKQSLSLNINEFVRGLQFDHEEIPNKCEVYGSVTCKVDVEESPEISLNFVSLSNCGILNQMAYHPSVQYVDNCAPAIKSDRKSSLPIEYERQKIRFSPPYDEFTLCHYKADLVQGDFPVKAFYQMKGDLRNVTIMIQLNLSEKMKNDFESFDVRIPFFNRGPISDITCLTSSASVYVLSDKATLMWDIGTKLPGTSKEMSLDMEVTFADASGGVVKPHTFLHKLNSYIYITWKMNDFSYSGLKFDTKSVELYPVSKMKVLSASMFKTVEYKVWNSHGDITDTTFSS